ncbi:dihydrolipoamide acetyltransferase family protein [Fimbriimonas ginsengisoli]|uniref:Dihydrolipoamide acetyltransferase component of pyruvate dehydrogenase complex n=1 Tax=Fimbriimonas ginsengisoli Gsoil 348 TaxID=661478 RepID=A0A068NQD8_FIMGI|nr:dihydrolipoamide acetyltransferase family protein [Fimbriimonas ginsengisoli]AIE83829.1 pyruvate dehydrogenase complex dihydrolipoamide acetyltransferase [Fimbriimonas ginsengisoli Gsoil 348]
MTEVIMPKMGDGMEEGTLLEWLKKEGDKVKTGEVIGTIQTDKATLELEAPGTGSLAGFLLKGGETVPVGVPIAAILKEGESLPAGWGGKDAMPAASAAAEVPVPNGAVPAAEAAPAVNQAAPAPAPAADAGRVKASPLARKIAQEKGLDLGQIQGSGPGGRIVEKDVRGATPAAPAAAAAPQPVAASEEDVVVPLPRLRQITAKRTLESKTQVPHFYVTVEVDVERIMELREMFERDGSGKISINDFVVKASALALRDMPIVNSVFQGDKLLQKGGVHVGIAVALEDGLTVPVIKNVDALSLRQISARAKELAKKARDNKLGMDELQGSTFAISNMGMLDVDNFIAIINQPNAAIVAIASVRKKVVVGENDEIEIRSRMNITGSFDHRVVDGAVGAKFINLMKDYLQNPTRLMS